MVSTFSSSLLSHPCLLSWWGLSLRCFEALPTRVLTTSTLSPINWHIPLTSASCSSHHDKLCFVYLAQTDVVPIRVSQLVQITGSRAPPRGPFQASLLDTCCTVSFESKLDQKGRTALLVLLKDCLIHQTRLSHHASCNQQDK